MFNIDNTNNVPLDLSAAFDTIDHQIFFLILEHSLAIANSALAFMKSYLDGRQQCVQIEGVISEFAELRVSFGTAEVLYLYATDRFNNASL